MMPVRPWHFGGAAPAPFRFAVLVIQTAVAVATIAVLGRPADMVWRLLALVGHAEPRGVALVALARLAQAGPAVERLSVDMVGSRLEVALAAVTRDPLDASRSRLAEAALAADRPEERALVLAADRAGLGIGALVLLGHHQRAPIARPLDLMQMARA